MNHKLGLGAVQFGLDYGVTNESGKTSEDEVNRILEFVVENSFRCIDTAPAYGDSEIILGEYSLALKNIPIVTKTVNIPDAADDVDTFNRLLNGFNQSLTRLNVGKVDALLVHSSKALTEKGSQVYAEFLQAVKADGKVKKIGVSVYTKGEIDQIFSNYDFDIVQLPISIYDQRLIESNTLKGLAREGIEIHARSIFLQGLTLLEPSKLSGKFAPLRQHQENYFRTLQEQDISPLEAAISFVQSLDEINVVVCGVNNSQQLREIFVAATNGLKITSPEQFGLQDEILLNPALW